MDTIPQIHFTELAPLVSVVIPAYNAEAFIHQTIESVLAQTYPNLEIIVIDDGSRDKTFEIVSNLARSDSRIRLFQQENAGVAAARNLAIHNSNGEFIAPIDADDIWFPENLEKQVKTLISAGDSVGLSYAWSALIDEQDNFIDRAITCSTEGNVYLELIFTNFIGNGSATVIRRNCFDTVGGYSTELQAQNAQGCEDWDLYLRIAEFYEFRVVPDFLIGYRKRIESMSCNYSIMARSRYFVIKEIQRKHPEFPDSIYRWCLGRFYLYLAGQCRDYGNHSGDLFWSFRAIFTDPVILFNHWLFKLNFISLLKLFSSPLVRLIWPNHSDWIQFKKRLGNNTKTYTLHDIKEKDTTPRKVKNLYQWIYLKRKSSFIQTQKLKSTPNGLIHFQSDYSKKSSKNLIANQ